MDWGIFLLAVTLACLWLAEKTRPPSNKPSMIRNEMKRLREEARRIATRATFTNRPRGLPNDLYSFHPTRIAPADNTWEIAASEAFNQLHSMNRKPRERSIVDEWKQSIIGLIRLSDQNINLAKANVTLSDFKSAIQTAGTSIENITRALLHCYGVKPDDDLGQEEALKLLFLRFSGKERDTFEAVTRQVATIHALVQDSFHKTNFTENDAQETIGQANMVSADIKQMMISHFTTEIPELEDRCPKCKSFDIQMCRSELRPTSFKCNSCFHGWTTP